MPDIDMWQNLRQRW